jgi:hypothetical protein
VILERCHGYDTARQRHWFAQQIPEDDEAGDSDGGDTFESFWELYWDCQLAATPIAPRICEAS